MSLDIILHWGKSCGRTSDSRNITHNAGKYLRANETTLMANANNGDEHINDGYHFFHLRRIRYLKNSMNWKWCYPGDIKTKED